MYSWVFYRMFFFAAANEFESFLNIANKQKHYKSKVWILQIYMYFLLLTYPQIIDFCIMVIFVDMIPAFVEKHSTYWWGPNKKDVQLAFHEQCRFAFLLRSHVLYSLKRNYDFQVIVNRLSHNPDVNNIIANYSQSTFFSLM